MTKRGAALLLVFSLVSDVLVYLCDAYGHTVGIVIVKAQTANVPNQPLQWKTFVSDDKSFTIQFPTEPIRECDIVNTPNGKIKVIEYLSTSNGILYAVMYGDCPINALSGLSLEQILDAIKNHAIENVRDKVLREFSISRAGYPGREITVKAANVVLSTQIILKDNRFYQLVVIAPRDEFFTSQEREFFDSFRILR